MRVEEERGKIDRLLDIYTRLCDGQIVNKQEMADRYCVNPRSIQRDMEDIRQFLDNQMTEGRPHCQVVYDRQAKGFRLSRQGTDDAMFTNVNFRGRR